MRWLWVIFLCVSAVARAADTDDAKSHYEKGLAAFALEHFSEAAEEYEKAFQLKADPALLYNAAQAHRLAGNNERAVRLYRNYLRIFGKRASNREEVTRHIRALEAAVETQRKAQSSPPTDVAEPSSTTTAAEKVDKPQHETQATPVSTQNNALTVTARPVEKPAPVYKKGWFWGVVVGAAVVVGVGVGLGVGLTTGKSKDPTPSFGNTTIP